MFQTDQQGEQLGIDESRREVDRDFPPRSNNEMENNEMKKYTREVIVAFALAATLSFGQLAIAKSNPNRNAYFGDTHKIHKVIQRLPGTSCRLGN